MTTTRRTLGRLVSAILLLLGLWLFDETLPAGAGPGEVNTP